MSFVYPASITLLLADNSNPMRKAIMRVISGIDGLTIVGEASGYSGMLEMAASLRPDIVLMDLHMDGEDDVSPEFVKTQLAASTKHVLAMSIWNDPGSKALARRYGANGLLNKANLVSELTETISALA